MPKILSRAALASVAYQQAKKFLESPRGKEFIAQAKQKASDPATRAKVNGMVTDVVTKVRAKAPQL